MPRIEIIAPSMDDDTALLHIGRLGDRGYDVTAWGPDELPADIDEPSMRAAGQAHDPDLLTPAERRDYYESEMLRLQCQEPAEPGQIEAVPPDQMAPGGWHIVAVRDERSG